MTTSEEKSAGKSSPAWIVLLVIVLCAVTLGPALWADIRAANIRSLGSVHEGTVTSLKDTGNRFNDDPIVLVTVEVEIGGRKVKGTVEDCISVVHLPRFQPGQRIKVWLDPKDPTRVALEEGL